MIVPAETTNVIGRQPEIVTIAPNYGRNPLQDAANQEVDE